MTYESLIADQRAHEARIAGLPAAAPTTTSPSRKFVLAAVVASGTTVLSTFLPWAKVVSVFGMMSFAGTDTGDGKLVLGLATAALIVAVATMKRKGQAWAYAALALLGAACAGIGLFDAMRVVHEATVKQGGKVVAHGSVGFGLVLTILSGAALVASAVKLWQGRHS